MLLAKCLSVLWKVLTAVPLLQPNKEQLFALE